MPIDDAIVAASSPPGRSLRGLVRVSGYALMPMIDAVMEDCPPPRKLTRSRLRLESNDTLPCLAQYFPGPGSFTGEDIFEVQVPGNPVLLDRVIHLILAAGTHAGVAVRIAEPGEFTQRAFMAGKLDLTRAEGIAATIGAVSDAQLQAAKLLRGGRLGTWATDLVDRIAQLLALVEAGIDFVDQDDVVPIGPKALDKGLAAIQDELASMLNRSRSWSELEALPWVVLVGRPNVGKSTLFNKLLGHDRAVTSNQAGTTRDVLHEPLTISTSDGRTAEVMIVDIAGLDRPVNEIDKAMQQAAMSAIDRAELVLHLDDGTTTEPDPIPIDISSKPVIKVHTKVDDCADSNDPIGIPVSAMTGGGITRLINVIATELSERAVSLNAQMLALRPRHIAAVQTGLSRIEEARQMLASQLQSNTLAYMELIADPMRLALDELASLGGEMTPDDVIGKVFATFCVGK